MNSEFFFWSGGDGGEFNKFTVVGYEGPGNGMIGNYKKC